MKRVVTIFAIASVLASYPWTVTLADVRDDRLRVAQEAYEEDDCPKAVGFIHSYMADHQQYLSERPRLADRLRSILFYCTLRIQEFSFSIWGQYEPSTPPIPSDRRGEGATVYLTGKDIDDQTIAEAFATGVIEASPRGTFENIDSESLYEVFATSNTSYIDLVFPTKPSMADITELVEGAE